MTVYLLVLVGVIWGAIVFLVLRYIHAKIKRFRWASSLMVLLALLGLAPLGDELWRLATLKDHCDGNAGWLYLNPVRADTLVVDTSPSNVWQVLMSPKVRQLDFVDARPRPGSVFDRFLVYGPNHPHQTCTRKTVYEDTQGKGGPLYWGQWYLDRAAICAIKVETSHRPAYRLKVIHTPAWWLSSFSEAERFHTDSRLQLIDEKSGRVLSEYRDVSVSAGFISRYIRGWGGSRYACNEQPFAGEMFWASNKLGIVKFLDKALLPVAD